MTKNLFLFLETTPKYLYRKFDCQEETSRTRSARIVMALIKNNFVFVKQQYAIYLHFTFFTGFEVNENKIFLLSQNKFNNQYSIIFYSSNQFKSFQKFVKHWILKNMLWIFKLFMFLLLGNQNPGRWTRSWCAWTYC